MQTLICPAQQMSAENVVQIVPACHALTSERVIRQFDEGCMSGAPTVQKLLNNGRMPAQ